MTGSILVDLHLTVRLNSISFLSILSASDSTYLRYTNLIIIIILLIYYYYQHNVYPTVYSYRHIGSRIGGKVRMNKFTVTVDHVHLYRY